MNELMKVAISSMNYFFLKETFSEINIVKEMFEDGDLGRKYIKGYNLYGAHIEEMCLFLNELVKNWNDDVEEIILTEMDEGSYIEDLSMEEVEDLLKKSIKNIGVIEEEKVLETYLSVAKKIKGSTK